MVREAVLNLCFLAPEQFDSWVRLEDITQPLEGSR